jgi:hypothetical protein
MYLGRCRREVCTTNGRTSKFCYDPILARSCSSSSFLHRIFTFRLSSERHHMGGEFLPADNVQYTLLQLLYLKINESSLGKGKIHCHSILNNNYSFVWKQIKKLDVGSYSSCPVEPSRKGRLCQRYNYYSIRMSSMHSSVQYKKHNQISI